MLVQQADHRIPQHRHHQRSLPRIDQVGFLARGDVLPPKQSVLDLPMPTLQGQQSVRCPLLGRQAGGRPVWLAVYGPGAFDPEHQGEPRPVGRDRQVRRRNQLAHL